MCTSRGGDGRRTHAGRGAPKASARQHVLSLGPESSSSPIVSLHGSLPPSGRVGEACRRIRPTETVPPAQPCLRPCPGAFRCRCTAMAQDGRALDPATTTSSARSAGDAPGAHWRGDRGGGQPPPDPNCEKTSSDGPADVARSPRRAPKPEGLRAHLVATAPEFTRRAVRERVPLAWR